MSERLRNKLKPLPLNTVELQKRSARFLKISSEETMRICEALYQKGFISYPRTETAFFAEGTDFNTLIAAQETSGLWGDYARRLREGGFAPPRRGKGDDHAHPPIHPTKLLSVEAAGGVCECCGGE